MTASTVSFRKRMVGRMQEAEREWQIQQQWMDAISVSDWVMPASSDPAYISPFQMQGCVFA